jgi:polysaccharide chain length determinant protein (PEP-CTERM system associated)
MFEFLREAAAQSTGMWRFRWHAVATAWVVGLILATVILLIPNTYRSQARVFVDTETVLRPLLTGLAVGTETATDLNLVSHALLSRGTLETVAKQTGYAQGAASGMQYEGMLERLRTSISIEGGGREQLYTISFHDPNAAMAQRVTQTFLDTFLQDTQGINQTDSENAQRFLEQQIAAYEKRLREAEARLADFKQRNVGLMPETDQDYFARMQASSTELAGLRDRLRTVIAKRNELQRQLEGEEPSFALAGSTEQAGGAFDARIEEQKRVLDQLLVQYTDKHPQVISVRENIAQLEAQRDRAALEARSRPQAAASYSSLNTNPVYQNMKIGLSAAEVEIAALQNEIGAKEREAGRLRGLVNTIPEVEAELARLNRDYEVNRAQHAALLQRLQSARLTEDAEASKRDLKFRIVEPPLVPLWPIAPNRPLLFALALLLSLAAGGALMFVLNQIKPVFTTRHSLREFAKLPVLGTVARIPIDPESYALERRQNVMLAATAGGLVLAFILVAVLTLVAPSAGVGA